MSWGRTNPPLLPGRRALAGRGLGIDPACHRGPPVRLKMASRCGVEPQGPQEPLCPSPWSVASQGCRWRLPPRALAQCGGPPRPPDADSGRVPAGGHHRSGPGPKPMREREPGSEAPPAPLEIFSQLRSALERPSPAAPFLPRQVLRPAAVLAPLFMAPWGLGVVLTERRKDPSLPCRTNCLSWRVERSGRLRRTATALREAWEEVPRLKPEDCGRAAGPWMSPVGHGLPDHAGGCPDSIPPMPVGCPAQERWPGFLGRASPTFVKPGALTSRRCPSPAWAPIGLDD